MPACAKPGCEQQIRFPRVVCRFHFAELPVEVRAAVVYRLKSTHDWLAAKLIATEYYEGQENGNHHQR